MKQTDRTVSNQVNQDRLETLHQCRGRSVGVLRAVGENRLVATREIAAGDRLFWIDGDLTPEPSRYSVQIGDNLHIDLGNGHSAEEILDRYFWRFMNHSCDPNALICEREVIASQNIHPREAVTFNYNTTEWDMAKPFICRCGSPVCLGKIQGYKHLTPTQRTRLRTVAPYLTCYGI